MRDNAVVYKPLCTGRAKHSSERTQRSDKSRIAPEFEAFVAYIRARVEREIAAGHTRWCGPSCLGSLHQAVPLQDGQQALVVRRLQFRRPLRRPEQRESRHQRRGRHFQFDVRFLASAHGDALCERLGARPWLQHIIARGQCDPKVALLVGRRPGYR
jgi:hypothetical protein